MKIAITGKGGVGKTTFSAMMIASLATDNRCVLALDADPDANLAAALGVAPQDQPTPLSLMTDLIKERTGAADAYGGYFKLNPKVDDIPDRYAVRIGQISLLALGGVTTGGGGCICPASALVKALLTHVILGRDDVVIMDMEAGIEHLGRATAQSMDALVIVVDEGPWSRHTALRIRNLASDLGMTKIFAVANRITDQAAVDEIKSDLGDIPLIGQIPFDRRLNGGVANITEDGQLKPTDGLAEKSDAIQEIIAKLQACT